MKYLTNTENDLVEAYSNKRFVDIKGSLSEKDAKLFLHEFLLNNIDFAIEFFFGFKIYPFQSYILSQWMNRSFCINVWSRGGSKTFLSALFCGLYGVFYPEKKIVLTSATFRSSRSILDQLDKFIRADGAEFLNQCYPEKLRRGTDLYEIPLAKGGFIKAVPLNEKIRGLRADVLFCDEGLLISKDLMEGTIKPFLLAKDTVQEQMEIDEHEDYLITKGLMKEEERTILESTKKMIILSSASFAFEYLHEIYQDWKGKCFEKNSKYFVSRLSYQALPTKLVEETIIKEAESGGIDSVFFQREYMALFPSVSDGYFNIKHMHECTYDDGMEPCVQIKGVPGVEYILSIDPSFSSSKTSDSFAMGVFMINKEKKTITLVNSYGVPGGKLDQHIGYFDYVLSNFNVVLVIADLLGGMDSGNFNFIESANLSSIFQEKNRYMKSFEGEFNSTEYGEEMRLMRKTYNKVGNVICYRQKFTGQWIKDANEYMQHFIQSKRLHFCSRIVPNEKEFSKYEKYKLPFEMLNAANQPMSIAEFCEEQDILITETKNQIALITPKINPQGSMTFDLPREVKAIKGEKRARKDNYTTTLMACWAAKIYFDFHDENIGNQESWNPFFAN
jgi:hypothetical protein